MQLEQEFLWKKASDFFVLFSFLFFWQTDIIHTQADLKDLSKSVYILVQVRFGNCTIYVGKPTRIYITSALIYIMGFFFIFYIASLFRPLVCV